MKKAKNVITDINNILESKKDDYTGKEHLELDPKRFPVNPFSLSCNKVSAVENIYTDLERPSNIKRKVKLAFISLCIDGLTSIKSLESNIGNNSGSESDLRRVISYSEDDAKLLFEKYQAAIDTSINTLKADIICVNELGFPATSSGPYNDAIDFSIESAKQNKLIVAGSYHDCSSKSNIGILFYPNSNSPFTKFYKQVCAHEEGGSFSELINVQPNRKTIVTKAFGLNVGVLICLDLASYSSVVSAVKNKLFSLDVLLICSYSSNVDRLRKIARVTSSAMPGITAIVNHAFTSKNPCISLFECGVEQVKQVKLKGSRKPLLSDVLIHTYEIDADNLWEKKQKKSNEQSQKNFLLKWLYGRSLDANIRPQ